jgi:hypothetical protein
VSGGLWTPLVDVQGLAWCKDVPKRIGKASLTQKTLCRDHNSGLSDVDTEGKRLFVAIGDAADLAYRRNRQVPHRRWKPVRFAVDGPLVERWFLKTTINIAIAQQSKANWALTDAPVREVPRLLVDVAFGRSTFVKPMGLYTVIAPSGEKINFEGSMSFAPLLKSDRIVGGIFTLRGLRYLIYFASEPPPQPLTLPDIGTKRMSEWEQGSPSYRTPRFRWRVGRHISHYIEYEWSSA